MLKLIFTSFKVFIVRGFGALSSVLLTLLITQILAPEDAGLFLLTITLIFFFGSLITLGSPTLIIRLVGAKFISETNYVNSQVSALSSITLILGLCLSFLFFFTPVFIADIFNKPQLASLLPIAGLCIINFGLTQLYAAAIQGKSSPVLASFIQNTLTPAVFIIISILYFFVSGSVSAYQLILIYTVSSFCCLLLALWCWYKNSEVKWLNSLSVDTQTKTSLSPLFVILIVCQFVQWGGQFAVGIYLPASDLVNFASAQKVAMLASFILIAVNIVTTPKFAKSYSDGDMNKLRLVSKQTSKLTIALSIPVLVVMLFYADNLMSIFGQEYVAASRLLQIMAIGQFINVITGSAGHLLNMTGYEKEFRNIVLFSGPLAVFLAFILTENYGVLGAAYATAISLAAQNILLVYFVKKRLGFNILDVINR